MGISYLPVPFSCFLLCYWIFSIFNKCFLFLCEGRGLLREANESYGLSLQENTHLHKSWRIISDNSWTPPWNTFMGLDINKPCLTFLISTEFHFSFYKLSHGIWISEHFPRTVRGWGVWHQSPSISTYNTAGASEQKWLLEDWEQCCFSLLLANFSRACLFKAAIIYLWEANDNQTLGD